MADSARAARGTDDRRRLADEPVLQVGQVRVNAGRPQLYSTQFTVTDRELRPRPIEDPARFSRVYRVLLQAARAEGFGSGRLPDFLGLEHGAELVLPGQEEPGISVLEASQREQLSSLLRFALQGKQRLVSGPAGHWPHPAA
jgi:hypothetical protein